MLEELKEMADLISKVEIITSQLDKIMDSPLVSCDSSAYAFLVSARFASCFAGVYLRGQLEDMSLNVNNEGNLS